MSTALTAKASMAGFAALSLSFLLHLGGGLRLALPDPQVQVAGGAPTTVARLGNSFRDVAQGSAQSAPPAPTRPVTPDTAQDVTPDQTQQVEPVKTPQTTPTLQPDTTPPLLAPSKAAAVTAPTAPEPVKTTAVKPMVAQATPAAKPLPPKPLSATPPTTTITALPDPKPAPKPTTTPPKAQAQRPPSAQGADRAERQGSAEGQRTATANAAAKEPAAQTAASGNAALTNYAGKVWRKIQRARPSSSVKGTTVIAIAISDRGRLTAVSVARSSGSAQLDQLALRAARKAAPFPAPPDRKPHRFTFKVRSK